MTGLRANTHASGAIWPSLDHAKPGELGMVCSEYFVPNSLLMSQCARKMHSQTENTEMVMCPSSHKTKQNKPLLSTEKVADCEDKPS